MSKALPLPSTTIQLPRTLVLVGLMGAGKTCIGRQLAQALKVPFKDADHEIEAAAGCSISDIFATHGEAAFRDGERRVMARLLGEPAQVLATGGGAFMNADTRRLIAAHGISLWLRADLDLLVRRTARRNHRPLLQRGDPRRILGELIERRYPVYAEADITIDSREGPPELTTAAALDALARILQDHDFSRRGEDHPLSGQGADRPAEHEDID